MFASIPNYLDFYTEAELHEGGVTCLMILNEIISAFDEVKVYGPPRLRVSCIPYIR